MLALRLVIVAGLFGVALWGLFSLLENLREPQLLRSAKAVIVKGCDAFEAGETGESDDAARLCPPLFCQKSLLDARSLSRLPLLPLRTRFEVTLDERDEDQHLIAGLLRTAPSGSERRFACLIENNKVIAARVIDAAQLDELSAQSGDWVL